MEAVLKTRETVTTYDATGAPPMPDMVRREFQPVEAIVTVVDGGACTVHVTGRVCSTDRDTMVTFWSVDGSDLQLRVSDAPSWVQDLVRSLDLTPTPTDDLEREEVAELRQVFDMQWKRMGEATALWRAEDPEARALVMPDLGDLLKWLMDRVSPTAPAPLPIIGGGRIA